MNVFIFLLLLIIVIATVLLVSVPLRQRLLSQPLLRAFRRILPKMSDTERDALEAGSVWWEGDLFSGKPDWGKLYAYPKPQLTHEEQAFLDNEVNIVCNMVDDWRVTTQDYDLPPEVWQYLKDQRFFGMIIPKAYGGLGFSALAHSEVITRLSTRSSALSVTVMVPNSLGPAELLLHYGTDAQKDYYLPRLATGQEIPAFALTSPWAGSDAAAIPDSGIVCKGIWDGQEVIGMRVTWDKRYITLGPVCTLLGLAFRLYDPDGLLGSVQDIGITCALVPARHPGVETGRRHNPLHAMFMNGPTRGKDVFMPLEFIIGGPEMAGQGWRMLMECLAAGRSISLPSSYAGMSTLTARAVGAYAVVRQQFRLPIGKFEGVEEALARIGGHTYLVDAARVMTAGAIDLGEKPSVVSAIVKYHLTERGRQVVNDGMDIIGGKGICLGPSNFLGPAYQQIPVGITVEGANILTRSLILFGQGAIRCHPYLLKEMHAAHDPDHVRALHSFDQAFWAHVRFTLGNTLRTIGYGLSSARFVKIQAPVADEMLRYHRQLSRYSAAFAMLADTSMLVLGGSLKMRERLSARLGDCLAQMYLASATLKRFEDDGRPAEDAPLAHWAVQDALHRMQHAFEGVIANFPNRIIAILLRLCIFPWGRRLREPSDQLGKSVARALMKPGPGRDRLTRSVHVPDNDDHPLGALEAALSASLAAASIDTRIRAFEKSGRLANNPQANVRDMAAAVHAAGGINESEFLIVKHRDIMRDRVIAVDDFPFELFGCRTDSAAPGQDGTA